MHLAPSKAKVLALWKDEYQPVMSIIAPALEEDLEEDEEEVNTFIAWEKKHATAQIPDFQDEYEKYITAPIMPGIKDARKWWLESTQQLDYPICQLWPWIYSLSPLCLQSPSVYSLEQRLLSQIVGIS